MDGLFHQPHHSHSLYRPGDLNTTRTKSSQWGSFIRQVSVRSFMTEVYLHKHTHLTLHNLFSIHIAVSLGESWVIVLVNCFILLSETHTHTHNDPGVSVRLAVTVWIVKECVREDGLVLLSLTVTHTHTHTNSSGWSTGVCGRGAVSCDRHIVSPLADPWSHTHTHSAPNGPFPSPFIQPLSLSTNLPSHSALR